MITEFTIIFWTVMATAGIASIYTQLNALMQRRSYRNHSLHVSTLEWPVAVYFCMLIILMGSLAHTLGGMHFWMLINLILITLIHANLQVRATGPFFAVQAVGGLIFWWLGASEYPFLWLAFVLGVVLIRSERWFNDLFSRFYPLFLIAPTIVVVSFWLLMRGAFPEQIGWSDFATYVLAIILSALILYALVRSSWHERMTYNELTREADYDALTEVHNWLAFQRDFNREFSRKTAAAPLAVIAIDVDHFKAINDRFGHLAGNRVLVAFTDVLKNLDAGGEIYRTGGEEFSLLLPKTTTEQVRLIANDCRNYVREMTVMYDAQPISVTASFGAAVTKTVDRDATAVFKRADDSLYRSKERGRDCVTVAKQDGTLIED